MKQSFIMFFACFCFISPLQSQSFPNLNASTGNLGEFIVDKDTNMYLFYKDQIVKTNKELNTIWSYTYNGFGFKGMLLSKTGSIFFYGEKTFGKLDPSGNVIWAKSFDNVEAVYGSNPHNLTVSNNRILLDRNDNLLLSGVLSSPMSSQPLSSGFFLKTDTNGTAIKLRLFTVYHSAGKFQLLFDTAGVYKFFEYGQGGISPASEIQYISYDDNGDFIVDAKNIFSYSSSPNNNYPYYWEILKSKSYNNFYLNITSAPNGFGGPAFSAVQKMDINGSIFWQTRMFGLLGITFGGSMIENTNGEILYELFNVGQPIATRAVATISSTGNTDGQCTKTFSITTPQFQNNYNVTSSRLQFLQGNKYFGEIINQDFPFNPLTIKKISTAFSQTCSATAACQITLNVVNTTYSQTPGCTLTPVNSYSINSLSIIPQAFTFTLITNDCVVSGLDEIENAGNSIKLFPNPTSSELIIDQVHYEKVIIYDAFGKIVLEQNEFTPKINVEHLSKGFYLIKLRSGSTYYTSKFIKE